MKFDMNNPIGEIRSILSNFGEYKYSMKMKDFLNFLIDLHEKDPEKYREEIKPYIDSFDVDWNPTICKNWPSDLIGVLPCGFILEGNEKDGFKDFMAKMKTGIFEWGKFDLGRMTDYTYSLLISDYIDSFDFERCDSRNGILLYVYPKEQNSAKEAIEEITVFWEGEDPDFWFHMEVPVMENFGFLAEKDFLVSFALKHDLEIEGSLGDEETEWILWEWKNEGIRIIENFVDFEGYWDSKYSA